MKLQFVRSFDFNQMLVFSVFGHLLVMVVVLFLPSPKMPEEVVIPPLVVDLVELPPARDSSPPSKTVPDKQRSSREKPVPEKSESDPPPPIPDPVQMKKISIGDESQVPLVQTGPMKQIAVESQPQNPVQDYTPVKEIARLSEPNTPKGETRPMKQIEFPSPTSPAAGEGEAEPEPTPGRAAEKPQPLKPLKFSKMEALSQKPTPPQPVVQPDPTNEILSALESLQNDSAGKPTAQELAELARVPPRKEPPAPKKARPQPLVDETLKPRDRPVQQEQTPPREKSVPPLVADHKLDEFDRLKMKIAPDAEEPEDSEEEAGPANQGKDLSKLVAVPEFEDVELAALPRKKKKENPSGTPQDRPPGEKTAGDVLKELQKMSKKGPLLSPKLTSPGEAQSPADGMADQQATYQPILKKLGALTSAPKEIKIDMVGTPSFSKEFKSGIWKVRVPDRASGEAEPRAEFVQSRQPQSEEADVLSLYIGKVRDKIYRKWREPLAQKHNKEVVVSFTIFPLGKIDKPALKKTSGVEHLDTLALRAILESEPFPKFPKELKVPNLSISIHFKYVPEKS